ncbi:uncharacterized protein LOC130297252 isoform X2 [Hyla sarda]|uniref:uncharacterized protein LOC130297252 isoform X2 n=1 Tax=Hyla sarda TaxID=327740 RepID=UPI0024C32C53|nr:uncharacterized protein LOC130297252 isoform X2 [Hyla sarda]
MTRITGSKITYSGCLATGHGWWLEPRLTPRETAAKAGEGTPAGAGVSAIYLNCLFSTTMTDYMFLVLLQAACGVSGLVSRQAHLGRYWSAIDKGCHVALDALCAQVHSAWQNIPQTSPYKHRGTNTDGVWTAHFTPRKTGNSIITAGRGTSIALFVNKLPTPPCSSAGRFTQVFTGRDYSRTSLIRLLLEERNNVSGGFWT